MALVKTSKVGPSRARDINGYIVMLMDMPSLAAFKVPLQAVIRRAAGAAPTQQDA